MSLASLHLSSSIPYPFQHTRYSNLPLNTQLSKICSTSYSSTLSHTTGGGGSCCICLAMVSVLYGLSSVTEKTGWVRLKDEGSLRQYAFHEMTFSIGYGLSHL